MDLSSTLPAVTLVLSISCLIAVANLLDFRFRVMAAEKARRAEEERLRRWGMPSPRPMNFDV